MTRMLRLRNTAAAAAFAALSAGGALAQAPAPAAAAAPEPDWTFTGNVGLYSQYVFRGISQTNEKPAVQGGIDYSNGGFYLGAWASSIKWIKDAGGDASVEIDVYAGYNASGSSDAMLVRLQWQLAL